MDTCERIVEVYVRYLQGYATIPNIKCGGQREIDLLAIHPKKGDRLHIETSISISGSFSKLTGDPFDAELAKNRVQKPKQRRTVGFFHKKKFTPPEVVAKLEEYGFTNGNYRKIIVSWNWKCEAEQQATEHGIELWNFQNLLKEIWADVDARTQHFADDTLRTIHLLACSRL